MQKLYHSIVKLQGFPTILIWRRIFQEKLTAFWLILRVQDMYPWHKYQNNGPCFVDMSLLNYHTVPKTRPSIVAFLFPSVISFISYIRWFNQRRGSYHMQWYLIYKIRNVLLPIEATIGGLIKRPESWSYLSLDCEPDLLYVRGTGYQLPHAKYDNCRTQSTPYR